MSLRRGSKIDIRGGRREGTAWERRWGVILGERSCMERVGKGGKGGEREEMLVRGISETSNCFGQRSF